MARCGGRVPRHNAPHAAGLRRAPEPTAPTGPITPHGRSDLIHFRPGRRHDGLVHRARQRGAHQSGGHHRNAGGEEDQFRKRGSSLWWCSAQGRSVGRRFCWV